MMKTNLKLSSKMHIFIIVSTVIIAIGLAVGLICEFVAGGYFNYGGDWASYKSITVSYNKIDCEQQEILELCDSAFSKEGISGYSYTFTNDDAKSSMKGELVYKFVYSTDTQKLAAAREDIEQQIIEKLVEGDVRYTNASANEVITVTGGSQALSMGAVVIAAIIVAEFIYFIVRYKLSMALAALLANVHNFALFIALLAITRIPVGSSVAVFAILTVVLTVIGCSFVFDRVRKNAKDEDLKKLSAFELTDKSADESLKTNILIPACLAGAAVVLFVLMSISSLSPLAIMAPVFGALASFAACAYGTAFFVPSVYSRFRLLGEKYGKKHARASRAKTNK